MTEVMRWKLKGFIPGVEGVSKALFQPWVVQAEDFDNATRLFLDAAERCVAAERREKELQQRLTTADERADTATSLIQRIVANFDTEIECHEDVEPNDLEHDQVLTEMREFLAGNKPAAQTQGEPVARHPDAIIEGVMTSVGITHAIYASTVSLKHGEQVKLYTEQPAPVATAPIQEDRETLIGYGRSSGLEEASTLCTRLAYAAYYPPGTRFKAFTPKAQKALGDLLIKASNEIASLPGGPYERFKARQAKKAESAKS